MRMPKLFHYNKTNDFLLHFLDKKISISIQNHFRLSNYQMLILIWVKGLWTGILISLILHYFIVH